MVRIITFVICCFVWSPEARAQDSFAISSPTTTNPRRFGTSDVRERRSSQSKPEKPKVEAPKIEEIPVRKVKPDYARRRLKYLKQLNKDIVGSVESWSKTPEPESPD